jgi:hypothetical protein
MAGQDRIELIRLRARIVALERCLLAAMELVLRVRPEELESNLELARSRLAEAYLDPTFASDVSGPEERTVLAAEVDRLMRAMQSDMGFKGGIQIPEQG